jgi:hypothetical protein
MVQNPAYGMPTIKKKYKKTIPKALREQVWLHSLGPQFSAKCKIPWCENTITVFDFQCGHNIPESKGGTTTIDNLIPICSRCNGSMGNHYTIEEWSNHFGPVATAKVAPAPAHIPTSGLAHSTRAAPIAVHPSRRFFCC